jgi:hypothetical protein
MKDEQLGVRLSSLMMAAACSSLKFRKLSHFDLHFVLRGHRSAAEGSFRIFSTYAAAVVHGPSRPRGDIEQQQLLSPGNL